MKVGQSKTMKLLDMKMTKTEKKRKRKHTHHANFGDFPYHHHDQAVMDNVTLHPFFSVFLQSPSLWLQCQQV